MTWSDMTWTRWLELFFAVTMIIGLVGFFLTRRTTDADGRPRTKGMGVRAIQFAVIIILSPSVVILSLEGIIQNQVIVGLFSAILGFAAGLKLRSEKDDAD